MRIAGDLASEDGSDLTQAKRRQSKSDCKALGTTGGGQVPGKTVRVLDAGERGAQGREGERISSPRGG